MDAAGDACVGKFDAQWLQHCGAADGVFVLAVGAVDQQIAGLQMRFDLLDHVFGDLPAGQHQPDDTRALQAAHEFADRSGAVGLDFMGDGLCERGVLVEHGDFLALLCQAARHVAAHFSEADEGKVGHESLAGHGVAHSEG